MGDNTNELIVRPTKKYKLNDTSSPTQQHQQQQQHRDQQLQQHQ